MKRKYILYFLFLSSLFVSCSNETKTGRPVDALPGIFPDYAGVTIPPNVAPLNFHLTQPAEKAQLTLSFNKIKLIVNACNGAFRIPPSEWKALLTTATGESIRVTISVRKDKEWLTYAPFVFHVSHEPMDSYLAYRLIEPGYELWDKMGIYQRNLEDYSETPIMENKLTEFNCMNCHSFCMQNPDKMLFHMRQKNAGTYLIDGDRIEKLNTKTDQTISALVYPSWHPSGKYVAFSVNETNQAFHMNHRNRIEVFDRSSDVVVYDVEKHEIVTAPSLFSKDRFETFPTFSPDGKTLFFCSAEAQPMPEEFEKVRYSLCRIAFDPDSRTFGHQVDTLYNATADSARSVSFPRVSPDGNYLLFTLSEYGNFSIWHRDADLYIADLKTNRIHPLSAANSNETESYHSWSSNSRWIAFSSRRIDGLYTRPYFVYVDTAGQASKPFLLPQQDSRFYDRFMKSYNIPEFITGPVKPQARRLASFARKDKGTDIRFAGK